MIHRINLMIANVYVIQQSRRVVLVDTGAPNSGKRIESALARLGIRPSEVALILLTHAHSDHAGSAAELRQRWGVPLAVHAGDRAMLERGTNGDFVPMDLEARLSRPFVDVPFTGITPDIVLDAGQDLSAYGLEAQLLHTGGHSAGSISLIFEDGSAIVGDILRGGIMGGTFLPQRPTLPFFMPSLDQLPTLFASIQQVLATGAQRWYVGHGGALPHERIHSWLDQHISLFQ